MTNLSQPPDPIDKLTEAEERRAAEEALSAQRNRAQHDADADGPTERVLLLPPEGYAVPPDPKQPGSPDAGVTTRPDEQL